MGKNKFRVSILCLYTWVILSLGLTVTFSCNRNTDTDDPGCGCGGEPEIAVEDEQAKMVLHASHEWFIERDSGGFLAPCNGPYPDSLKVENLQIIWSGDIMKICPNEKLTARITRFSEIKIL